VSDNVGIHIGATQNVSDAAAKASEALSGLKRSIDEMRGTTEKAAPAAESFGASFQGIVIGAVAAYAAIKKFVDIAMDMVSAFAEHESAVVSLTAVLTTNTAATNKTIYSLMDYASKMQTLTGIDEDLILRSMNLLAVTNMSEDSMKNLTTAAIELSKTGLIPFQLAMRGLTSSVEDGTLGLLGRYIPEIKNMSAAQMEAGGAIDFVLAKYVNLLPALENTTQTIMARTGELWNDQKKRIGEVFASLYANVDKTQGVIKTIGDYGVGIATVLVNVASAIPGFLKLDYDASIGLFKLMVDLFIAVAKTIWAPFQWAFHDVAEGIKSIFVTVINFLLDQVTWVINKIGEGIKLITGGKFGGALADLKLGSLTYKEAPSGQSLGELLAAPWVEFAGKANDFWDMLKISFQSMIDGIAVPIKTLDSTIQTVQNAAVKLENVIDTAFPNGAPGTGTGESGSSSAPTGAGFDFPNGAPGTGTGESGSSSAPGAPAPGMDLTGPLNSVLSTVESSLSNLGETGQFAADIVQGLANGMGGMAIVMAAINVVIKTLIALIGPQLIATLKPIMDILHLLGTILAAVIIPILQILEPVLKIVAYAFLIFYNVALVPLINAIIWAFNLIYDMVGYIWNAIAGAINFLLGWLGVHIDYMTIKSLTEGMLKTMSMGDMENNVDAATGSDTGASSNTTIQKPPDINVYITVMGDVVAEDLGRRVVDAIAAYLGTGARVAFLERPPA
jgi:hypothetical protein